MKSLPMKRIVALAFWLLMIGCGSDRVIESNDNASAKYMNLAPNERLIVELPNTESEYDSVIFQFPTEPGKIYQIELELPKMVWFYRDQLCSGNCHVFWQNDIHFDTILLTVDSSQLSKLIVYTYSKGRENFTIRLSSQTKVAWWMLSPDSLNALGKSQNSVETSMELIPNDSAAIIDTSKFWFTRAFVYPPVKPGQYFRSIEDSNSHIAHWYSIRIDSNFTYNIKIQTTEWFPIFLDIFDDSLRLIKSPSATRKHDKYGFQQSTIALETQKSKTIYLRWLQYNEFTYQIGASRQKIGPR